MNPEVSAVVSIPVASIVEAAVRTAAVDVKTSGAPPKKPHKKVKVKKATKMPMKAKAGFSLEHPAVAEGPAIKRIPVKAKKVLGVCMYRPCSAKVATKARWCQKHRKVVRKIQLKLNNVTWHARTKKGTAGHHLSYRGRPTKFTVKEPAKALAAAQKGFGVTTPDALKVIIKKELPKKTARPITKGGKKKAA